MSDSQNTLMFLAEIRTKLNLTTRWVRLNSDFLSELQGSVAAGFGNVSELVGSQNATIATLAKELDVLKGRQAASAALQVIQFLLFAGYLITLAVFYVVKKCKKYRKKQVEEEVELMEQKLQDRKARRRAAARQSPADK